DVYVGSPVSLAARITQMMSVIGSQPVMWVNDKSLLATGPYSETGMLAWNSALLQACARYPNIPVYDSPPPARGSGFTPAGIHFPSGGYGARAHRIAPALAAAFPAGGARGTATATPTGQPGTAGARSPACLVR